MNAIASLVDRNIGRCPRCMHISFLAGGVASIIAVVVALADFSPLLSKCINLIAVGLALLWVSHVIVMSARLVRAVLRGRAGKDRVKIESVSTSRRSFFPLATKALAAATLISVLPRAAHAALQCSKTCPNGSNASQTCPEKYCTCMCDCAIDGDAECHCVGPCSD
jgi:hypothetical protein